MLSQAVMDRLGVIATRMQGTRMELVTYSARASAAGTVVTHADLQVRFRDYRVDPLNTDLLHLVVQECVIRTALVTWTPTVYDEIVRSTGARWKVVGPILGGRGRPHFLLQVHQIA